MAKLNVFTYDNLKLYDELLKSYVDERDAKSLKTVAIVGNTVNFYREEEPVADGTEPAYSIELPETDLSGLLEKLENATVGNVVVANADGTVKDGGVALADLATKEEVEAVDAKTDANAEDIAENAANIKAISDDYLKAADKTELADAITAEETRAKAAEEANANVAKAARDVAGAAQDDVTELEEVVSAMYTNEQIDEAIATAKSEATYNDEEVRGLISDNADAITVLNGDESTEGSVAKAVKDSADAINATIGEVTEGKTVVEMIADAQATATYDDSEVRELIAENATEIEAHKTAIDSTVATLVGDDANKSVRTIANEELAAQLLSGEADADFQTIQELAAWLEDHPEDVATINLNITNLQKLVGALPEDATATDVVGYIAEAVAAEKARAEGVESGLDERLQAVETAVGEGGNVETQINNAIAELDADVTSATVEEGKGIQVQVVEVDGKVTTVAVTGNYDNVYDAKGAATTAVTELANGQVATNQTNIEALQELVGEGYTEIAEADIRALFE